MDDERWRRGYARLEALGRSFDLQAPWWNLDQAVDPVRDFPGTIFGPMRTMFGSNYPVDSLVESYRTLLGGFLAAIAPQPPAAPAALLHDNACRIYRL